VFIRPVSVIRVLYLIPDNHVFLSKCLKVNKKWAPYILIALLLIAVIVIKQFQKNDKSSPKPKTTTTKPKDPATNPTNRDKGFDRRTALLEYSNHAKCRMQCRKISQAEVEEIMRDGKINYTKSDLQNVRCPRYAVEGETNDNQRVRIVYAQCNESTTVVTVIDLETDFKCSCPGDDDKYKNRN
jgi:uncharacterized DUF497 family protein